MLRQSLIVLAAAGLMGCTASLTPSPTVFGNADKTELAAYAAKAQYPHDSSPADNGHVAALLHGSTIGIENLSDEPLQDVKVWVNGAYVYRVDSITAHTTKVIPTAYFYNAEGTSLAAAKLDASRVEIENNGHLDRARIAVWP